MLCHSERAPCWSRNLKGLIWSSRTNTLNFDFRVGAWFLTNLFCPAKACRQKKANIALGPLVLSQIIGFKEVPLWLCTMNQGPYVAHSNKFDNQILAKIPRSAPQPHPLGPCMDSTISVRSYIYIYIFCTYYFVLQHFCLMKSYKVLSCLAIPGSNLDLQTPGQLFSWNYFSKLYLSDYLQREEFGPFVVDNHNDHLSEAVLMGIYKRNTMPYL